MLIQQFRSTDGTGTLSHMVIDEASATAIIIDPNSADVQMISRAVREQNLSITHIFDTHTHADHVSGAAELQKLFGATIVMHENTKNKWNVIDHGDTFGIGDILRANAKIPVDVSVSDGDEFALGSNALRVLFTPGHTDNHIALVAGDNLFTGDLLLIGQAGRSDLPGGNAEEQFDSLKNKILPLPDTMKLFPGHDYEGNSFAFLGNEKRTNPFLKPRTKEEYVKFVQDFFPPLAEASAGGKMTLQCGTQRVTQPGAAFNNISAAELNQLLKAGTRLELLDVREPMELMMMGAIEGVKNISVRQLMMRASELPNDTAQPIVTICASGNRSVEAAHVLQRMGYSNIMNLVGGTSGWIRAGFPVVRNAVRI